MNYVKKSELFTVPQKERVSFMREIIPQWMNELDKDEQLLIGLPEVLGDWKKAIPLVVFKHMVPDFLQWLEENEEHIAGPNYNLPALSAHFLCVVIDQHFDHLQYEPPENASDELIAVLQALAGLERSRLEIAA